jgi:DNA-binding GntR family transcriptional regulator
VLKASRAEVGVSLGVVKRAMTQLRDERGIVIRHGQGAYVRAERGDPETQNSATLAAVQAELADMGKRLDAIERRRRA